MRLPFATRIFAAAVIALTLVLSACTGSTAPPPPPSRSAASTASAPPTPPSPSGIEVKPGTFVDPVVVSFCVSEERIIGMEARIIQERFGTGGTQRAFRSAARLATRQIPMLRQGDRPEAAEAVRRWAAALRRGVILTARGERGYDALRPALEALGGVNDALSCELDLDDPVPETGG